MKRIQVTLTLLKACIQAFYCCMNSVSLKQDCYWTINETFFTGEGAENKRDAFQREYNEMVEKYKIN